MLQQYKRYGRIPVGATPVLDKSRLWVVSLPLRIMSRRITRTSGKRLEVLADAT